MEYELTKKLKNIDLFVPVATTAKIRLDANELPADIAAMYPDELSQIVREAALNRYPDPRAERVTKAFAECYGLDVGSEMEIAIGGTQTASVRVAGVFENYIGTTLVMSGDYYEKIYGGTLQPNAFMVNLNGADAEKLNDSLQNLSGYETTTRSDVSRTIIETSSASLK